MASVKFYPVHWLGRSFKADVNASAFPDSIMYQFGLTSNSLGETNATELANGRRRRRLYSHTFTYQETTSME